MPTLLPHFEKATSDNLPKIDELMLFYFFKSASFCIPESGNVKVLRSAEAMYSDNAIGWVQVRRFRTTNNENLCEVLAFITPEHKVNAPAYKLHCIVDEKEDVIKEARCESCRAQNDGCKHAVAFITWLYRKAKEPSVTSVQCYWKRSALSTVGGSGNFSLINETKQQRQAKIMVSSEDKKSFFNEVCSHFKQKKETTDMLFLKLLEKKDSLSMHHLMMRFISEVDENDRSCDKFLEFSSRIMTDEECRKLCKLTEGQSESSLWMDLRYARITASKVYEAARCKTPDGVLVNGILSVVKIRETKAIKRGKFLEKEVLKEVSKRFNMKIERSGFVMKKMHPAFGVSPDGIMGDFVIEVKCPISEKTFDTYFEKSGNPAKKHKGQIALQMYFCDKVRGLFCVAYPDFETSRRVKIIEVSQNQNFLNDIMRNSLKFWSENVYPILHSNM